MYNHIMIPVDLGHLERMEKALQTGADLARHYDADITYMSVTGVQPSAVAHSPEEFATKLDAFAAKQRQKHGLQTRAKSVVSHDPAVEIDTLLLKAAEEAGADLIVAATHVPSFFGGASHGGKLASHAKGSVLLVRPG